MIKYVVLDAGFGYNDEYYTPGESEGDQKIHNKAFDSKEEARTFIVEEAKKEIGGTAKGYGKKKDDVVPSFYIGDFGEGMYGEEVAREWLEEVHPECVDSWQREYGYSDIAKWCDENNTSFAPYIPAGIWQIFEVEV